MIDTNATLRRIRQLDAAYLRADYYAERRAAATHAEHREHFAAMARRAWRKYRRLVAKPLPKEVA